MRSRLILLVGATSSLVLIAFLVPLAILVRSTAADRAMSTAVAQTQTLAPLVATLDDADLDDAVAQANASWGHEITVFLPDRTVGIPAVRTLSVEDAATGRSITAEAPGGREVLVAVSGLTEGTAVIRMFVPHSELTAGVGRAWLVLGLLGLGLLLVSLLVADRLARALTRPIQSAAQASYQLARGDLDARAAVSGPREIQQVSLGLNLLASRIGELLANERESVADLSHRIRTPLTALRIDAEALTDRRDRERITADLDAVERTVDEVIRQARRPVREGVTARCDAAEVVTDRLRFWSALAEEENRCVVALVAPGPVDVRVSCPDLSACLDALLNNVFTHTAEGVGFTVELSRRKGGGAYLIVTDDGPGLPNSAALARGHSEGGSTGLGLDIVRRTAQNSGGTLRVDQSATHGARFVVELGPPVRVTPR